MHQGKHAKATRRLDVYSLHAPTMVSPLSLMSRGHHLAVVELTCFVFRRHAWMASIPAQTVTGSSSLTQCTTQAQGC